MMEKRSNKNAKRIHAIVVGDNLPDRQAAKEQRQKKQP